MRIWLVVLGILAVSLLVSAAATNYYIVSSKPVEVSQPQRLSEPPQGRPPVEPSEPTGQRTPAVKSAHCHYRASGALPDPACTPGVRNPAVTQATIAQTICVAGWTRTVRPPLEWSAPKKRESLADYGVEGMQTYQFDHYLPLELGGHPTDPGNLWPLEWEQARAKDRVANQLRQSVCSGRIKLEDAQRFIVTDWREIR